jgi:hypothetical protein
MSLRAPLPGGVPWELTNRKPFNRTQNWFVRGWSIAIDMVFSAAARGTALLQMMAERVGG